MEIFSNRFALSTFRVPSRVRAMPAHRNIMIFLLSPPLHVLPHIYTSISQRGGSAPLGVCYAERGHWEILFYLFGDLYTQEAVGM